MCKTDVQCSADFVLFYFKMDICFPAEIFELHVKQRLAAVSLAWSSKLKSLANTQIVCAFVEMRQRFTVARVKRIVLPGIKKKLS